MSFAKHPTNMVELTIGYVAGLISLGVFIGMCSLPCQEDVKFEAPADSMSPSAVQVLYPTSLTFILAGVLREKETAATW